MKRGTKLKPVIVTARGAEVCQRCLVKWARQIVNGRMMCNTCAREVEAREAK